MMRKLTLTICLCLSSLLVMAQGDTCADAIDISAVFGNPIGEMATTTMFDNTTATAGADDPTVGYECFADAFASDGSFTPSLENTMWFSFVGDGGTYFLNTVDCGSTNYNVDTQFALYSGDCGTLTPEWCNEDGPDTDGTTVWPAGGTFITEAGVNYFLMVDGWSDGSGVGAVGEFCLAAMQMTTITCADISAGEYNFTPGFVCPDDMGTMEVTAGTAIPISDAGLNSGFFWFVSTEELTGGDPTANAALVGNLGFQLDISAFTFANTADSGLDPGDYYFTAFAFGNTAATADGNLDFSTGCFTYGESIPFTFGTAITATVEVDEATQTLTASATGGSGNYEFLWDTGESGDVISYGASGTYIVAVSDGTDCTPGEASVDVVVSGISDIADLNVALFPNPSQDFLTLNWNADLQLVTYSVINLAGQELKNGAVNNAAKTLSISVEDLSNGQYILLLSDDKNEKYQSKFVVSK